MILQTLITLLAVLPVTLTQFTLSVDPPTVRNLIEGTTQAIQLTLNYNGSESLNDSPDIYHVTIHTSNAYTVILSESSVTFNANDIIDQVNKTINITAYVLGYVDISFTLFNPINQTMHNLISNYVVTVVRASDFWDNMFTILMAVLALINTINMGCGLDLNIVKKSILRPIGPIVGFISQFTFMPLFSFALAMLLIEDKLKGFGLFVIGVCPGGMASNFWTLLFNGDINLSITMTFVSSISALGMMPLWIWLLSGFFLDSNSVVRVPYKDLIISLILLTIPLGIGLLIRRWKPKIAKFLSEKVIKPFSFVCILLMFTLGFYSLSHIFILLDGAMILAGVCVAWGGFFFGAFFAWLTRLSRPQIVAVSLETALQNGNIAFILLKFTIPSPYSDIAALPPIAMIIMTSATLLTTFTIYTIHQKCCKKKNNEIVKMADNEKPLMIDISPGPFHGGQPQQEFAWVNKSTLIVPNSP